MTAHVELPAAGTVAVSKVDPELLRLLRASPRAPGWRERHASFFDSCEILAGAGIGLLALVGLVAVPILLAMQP